MSERVSSSVDLGVPVVAVVGAAGLSGTYLLNALRPVSLRARAVVHSEAGGKRAAAAGADEIVQAELADPVSVRAALEGVDFVYMIPPSMDSGEDAFAINTLRAAEAVGVKRFVYVSVLHPHTPSLRHHMRKAHAEAEIRDSSLAWTFLQPAMYAQMVSLMFGSAPAGPVKVPFDTSLSFSVLDLRELSEIAVKVLTEEGHEFATYELCGPALTMAEMVRIAGRVRGVDLEPTRIPPSSATLPPRFAERPSSAADMIAMWEEYDRHGLRGNSTVLRTLLGRAPSTFEDVARSTLTRSTK